MAFKSWRGDVGLIKPTMRPGSLEETIRATVESLGLADADVLGPNPCALARLRSRYRYDLLLRTRSAGDMHKLTDCLNQKNALRVKVDSVMLDVDPVSMM